MLVITGNDIKELSDSDLRSLIGLLCEAELRANGLPTAGVTWGGHQNASDGGIDVRVELTTNLHTDSFIPRSKTGFQVKKPDMPRSSIISEMRPKGEIRQIIKDLVDANGAYIIVSSQGSTSDSALKNRKDAMHEALSDYPNAFNAKLDFYDRERVAGWVRSHPSLVLWVRDKIGRPIQGWKAYGNWANCPGGVEEEYLLDGHIRLYNNANPQSDGLSAIEGINKLRTILHRPTSSIRLVGLSGVGKTRLVQSLFDERIGERPLKQSQVFYTDISDIPNPDPRNFAERLIAFQRPSILVIDNCPPDLHRRLTSVCSASGSLVSLITIEYDVREDQPEETEVFRLEPSSTELIKKVISARFSYISQVDVRTIAEISGGNARIAIALANTIQRGESVSNLRDDELFLRLFHQRNEPSHSLLKTAEVCSLVYSFDCQTIEGTESELGLLGSLIGMSVGEVYGNVSELKRRNLVQQRGIWRAVLPHAVANKLAKRALENIPLDNIHNLFEKSGSERLLKSFSRRLSYLHESNAAIEISRKWLSEDGLLGDVTHFNELDITLFKNIAPINPELTLSVIERASNLDSAQDFYSRNNNHYNEFTRLLRSLAYDKDLFERSTGLLCRFALSESPDENQNSIRELLKSLFYIMLSGTHATPIQRFEIIKGLVESNAEEQIELGIYLLEASLESWHFSSSYGFEFGAHARDYGFSPSNSEEVHQWFKLFIEYTVTLAVSDLPLEPKVKALLAKKFRGLWIKAGMYDELEVAAKQISSKGNWNDGWIAVKTTKRFDGKRMELNILSRLDSLDAILKPTTLVERAKIYALSPYVNELDLIDTIGNQDEKASERLRRVESITRSLGHDVGNDEEIFKELLPHILSNEGTRLYIFGQGLADGTANPRKMWQDFREQLSYIESSKRNYQVLRGFLNAISKMDMNLYEEFLDETVTDKVLAIIYPWLQTSTEINIQGVERLKQSLKFGVAPIWQYQHLAYGRAHETISDDELYKLLKLISSHEEGIVVSVEILHMRLYGHSKGDAISSIIVSLGQELLLDCQFSRNNSRAVPKDYKLVNIINACFAGEAAEENAKRLCSRLVEAFANHEIYPWDYGYVLKALATMQPIAFLDVFLGEDFRLNNQIEFVFIGDHETKSVLTYINDELIIEWCEANPDIRYPIAASAILPYQKSENKNLLEWTPLALKIITYSPDPSVVLKEFKSTFRPTSWSGSRADIMQTRLCLISELKRHENTIVADWASKEERVFEKEIRSEREWELRSESERNEGFE